VSTIQANKPLVIVNIEVLKFKEHQYYILLVYRLNGYKCFKSVFLDINFLFKKVDFEKIVYQQDLIFLECNKNKSKKND